MRNLPLLCSRYLLNFKKRHKPFSYGSLSSHPVSSHTASVSCTWLMFTLAQQTVCLPPVAQKMVINHLWCEQEHSTMKIRCESLHNSTGLNQIAIDQEGVSRILCKHNTLQVFHSNMLWKCVFNTMWLAISNFFIRNGKSIIIGHSIVIICIIVIKGTRWFEFALIRWPAGQLSM